VLSLLCLQLENPPPLEVAAAECGARNDVPGEVLELRPNIQLAPTVGALHRLHPSANQLVAARGERRQHTLKLKVSVHTSQDHCNMPIIRE